MTWVVGLIGLGIVVFIHEFGHFVAAKLSGVEVETFSLGWGPRLVGFQYRGTWYQIAWLPIGGFCKMKGELISTVAGGQAGAADAAAAREKGSFLAASPFRRILIAVFGPAFNLVFAILGFAAIWWVGFQTPSFESKVVVLTDYPALFKQSSAAAAAGMKSGDRVVSIDGVPIESYSDIFSAVAVAPGKPLTVVVQREADGAVRNATLTVVPQLDKEEGSGKIGVWPWITPVVESVEKGSAAANAGLRRGDTIVGADGRPVHNELDVKLALAGKPAKISVTYERGGARETATLVFAYVNNTDNLGITYRYKLFHSPPYTLVGALNRSLNECWSTVALTVKGIGMLFHGVNLRNAVAGPLRIVDLIGSEAKGGFSLGVGDGILSFIRILALLSVVLFMMNLLPIPALDGGQVVLYVVEIIRRKAASYRVVWRLQIVGFTLLITLFVFATFNDALRLMGR